MAQLEELQSNLADAVEDSEARVIEAIRALAVSSAQQGPRRMRLEAMTAQLEELREQDVEFLDEVEALFADVDQECLGMCLDTGHLAYAGIDPVSAIDHFSDRIDHVHFKDVKGRVLAQAREEGWDFWQAIAAGIFCPIGEGVVDFPGVIGALSSLGFSGTATIEQDRPPDSSTDPLADLRASVAHVSPLLASDES
mgnify:CR=1 FL=1